MYLEGDEVNTIILLMLKQWRAGLRVSEVLNLEVRDLSLDSAYPSLLVRSDKSGKSRLVPVHPELHSALTERAFIWKRAAGQDSRGALDAAAYRWGAGRCETGGGDRHDRAWKAHWHSHPSPLPRAALPAERRTDQSP